MTNDKTRAVKSAQIARKGMVAIFMGDGKGKTTAAIGTAVRASGWGLRVFVVFFMKGKMFSHGEVKALAGFPNIVLASFGQQGWVKKGENNPEAGQQALKAMDAAHKAIHSGEFDVVVLDEINGAVDFGLVPVEDLVEMLASRPESVDVILTGRHADNRIIQMADVVTEMVNVKHAFEHGIKARAGIDY